MPLGLLCFWGPMPFTDATAPDFVKRLPKDKRATWVKVWNSAFARVAKMTKPEQKKAVKTFDSKKSVEANAEAYAFGVANAVVSGKTEELERMTREALLEGRVVDLVLLALYESLPLKRRKRAMKPAYGSA